MINTYLRGWLAVCLASVIGIAQAAEQVVLESNSAHYKSGETLDSATVISLAAKEFVLLALEDGTLLRVAGPSLAPLGVGASGLLPDPKLTLFEGPTRIAENDDWDATPELKKVFLDVGAFEFASDDSKDAAIAITLQPGLYTVHASAATGGAGVALIEIYEVP